MPPTLTYPGVYIEEAPSSVHPITAVATSITAFIGRALRGPVDRQVTITSFSDFERIFGGVWLESNLGYAVQDFYRNGGSTAIIVRVHKTKAGDTATIALGTGNEKVALAAASPGAWGSKLSATIDDNVADASDTNSFNLTVTDTGSGKVEVFRNVSLATGSPQRYDKVLANQSTLVVATTPLATQPQSTFPATATASTSNDGDPVDASVFTGGTLQTDKKGLYALENADLVNIIVIPPYTSTGEIDSSVLTDTIAYAVKRRAMMIIDPPAAWTSVASAVTGAGGLALGANASNAAAYFPAIQESDPLQNGLVVPVAPSGAIAGIWARTDGARGVWKAPAGLEAGIGGALALSIPLTDDEIGELNPLGVNCLRNSPGAGVTVWGARTADGNDRLASQWKYLPVRRTALFLEESLYRGTQWVVFEPNDAPLWAQIRLNVGSFMSTLFRQGAFAGTTPREAFFVKCDSETTTPTDVANGVVNIVVGFAPLQPAEFVVIVLQQMAGQTGGA